MAKKGIFRRIAAGIVAPVKKATTAVGNAATKTTDAVKRTVTRPFKRAPKKTPAKKPAAPTLPPVPAPRPAPPIGEPLSPGQRAQTYIDDLKARGKEAVYPSDFSTEDWRAFDERGGTPSLGGGK